MNKKLLIIRLFFLINAIIFLQFLSIKTYASSTNNSKQIIDKKVKDSSENKNNLDSLLSEDYYLIGPGDELNLILFGAPEFSGEYKVLNDGTVSFPLIGATRVINLGFDEATELLQEKFSKELIRPELNLTLKSARPIKISVIGEIIRPGIYSLTIDESSLIEGIPLTSNQGLPTIVDAIQKAGGLTQNASLEDLIIKRRIGGKKISYKVARIDLYDLIFNGNHEQNIILFDGDVLKIEKSNNNFTQEKLTLGQTNLSPQEININVVGEVIKPGQIVVPSNTSLVQGILYTGGPINWKANKGNIELIRLNDNGTVSRKKFKLNLNTNVSNDKNPVLQDKDIVVVNSNNLSKISTGLGAATEPIAPVVTVLTLFKLLN